ARLQARERVPRHRVAPARLVHGEVRLEHAAVDAELFDGELVVVPGRVGELLAARRAGPLVPAEAVDLHVAPAGLGHDVGAGGELADGLSPLGVHVLGSAGIRADRGWPAGTVGDAPCGG